MSTTPTAAEVKQLRDLTGAGMMDCKKALTEAEGDFDKAVEILRIKGAKDVGKRAGRTAANGLVAHAPGVMVELKSETDFVAKNADFVALADRFSVRGPPRAVPGRSVRPAGLLHRHRAGPTSRLDGRRSDRPAP